ncbi:MAG: sugar-binding domain-containing protein [Rikenellaceae bacterium]
MRRVVFTLILALVAVMAQAQSAKFNDDWKFTLSDQPEAKQIAFDDSQWCKVDLPHDWAFEQGYSKDGAQKANGGYAMGGIGWYRKAFDVTAEQLRRGYTFIDFEGVYMNSEVWINGEYLGKRPYGYISFSYDLTDKLVVGENIIAVRVDNTLEPSARWYHGCGIYADVYLRSTAMSYFEKDGTFITTPQITDRSGAVAVSTEIMATSRVKSATVNLVVTAPDGSCVAKATADRVSLDAGLNTLRLDASVDKPMLWSPDAPNLYTAELTYASAKGEVVDQQSIRFGFRTVAWDAATGFYLNGENLKLRGVCEHMEGGPIGALGSEEVIRWRMQQIKDMGCNAVRTAHNPYWPVFYDICDEIGLLVMDEIFDGWKKKAYHDYGAQAFDEWWERDLTSWIRRDRNHPSVFVYSLGNETHGDIAPTLVAACTKLDSTRLTTSGDCNPLDMGVYGVNGRSETPQFINNWVPKDQAFVATENPHTWQVRGYYRTQTWYRDGMKANVFPVPDLTEEEIFGYDWTAPENRTNAKQIFNSSYDNAFVRVSARKLIEVLRDTPWFSGSFRWTGYDYLGEAGYVHGGWPFKAFQSGALDLAGFPKDLFFLYQSQWSDKDMVHILPHWTHPMMEAGTLVPICVYTNGDEAELFFNGESLGRKRNGAKWDEMQIEWLVPWAEGEITAVAYRNGVAIATACQKSSQQPSRLGVSKYEDRELKADKEDVIIVTVEQQDAEGTLYPYGENRLYTKFFGDARMLSFTSGSPVDVETNFGASSMEFFFGLNRMFIQSTGYDSEAAASVLIGSISGDKKLMLSNMITINTTEIPLRGRLPQREVVIRYTTNGEQPTLKSQIYTVPFAVEMGTTVKAIVCEGEQILLDMSEEFSLTDGLYWSKPVDQIMVSKGEQAEYGALSGAYVTKVDRQKVYAKGYNGSGFVIVEKAGGSITWYQENDGEPFEAKATIRYSQEIANNGTSKMELWNNDTKIGVVEFQNTGSTASNWKTITRTIKIGSGGNNIRLVALDDNAPALDQILIE